MCRWHCPIQAVTPRLLYFLVLCQGMLHWVLLLSRTTAQHRFGLWIGCCIADNKLSRRELTLKALFTSVVASLQGCHLQLCWAALILNHLPATASPPPQSNPNLEKAEDLSRYRPRWAASVSCCVWWLRADYAPIQTHGNSTGKSSPIHTHICNLLWIES